jgi:hypothetical protein
MDASDRSAMLQKIAKVEEQLVSLARQKEEAEAELRSLRMQLAKGRGQTLHSPSRASTHHVSSATPLTPDDKVALFLRLFRGRDHVYPVLWQNQKTGKKGYSPACANEWVRGVCEKPRVKCEVCPNQAFLPVTADRSRPAEDPGRPRHPARQPGAHGGRVHSVGAASAATRRHPIIAAEAAPTVDSAHVAVR